MALPPILVELRASSAEFTAKMKEARAEITKLDAQSASTFNKVAKAGKYALLGVAAGVAAIGFESVKMAGDFEKETNLLVTAAGESQAALAGVRKGILEIASTTGTTWQGLTEGMYQVEKAGYRGADGLKVLKAAAQGAAEEGADLSVVTNAMTSVMASYHFTAEQSVEVMNALKTAAGATKDTMQNFAGSLSTVLPIASAAGLDFAQVGGAIATLTQHGTSAAEATQELAFTIRNLQAPNKVALKQLEQWGISSNDLSINLGKRGLGGTLEYLVDTISKKMGPSGLVLQDTFKRSKSAGEDMSVMIKNMSPAAQQLSKDLMSNVITLAQYKDKTKELPADQLAMARQFATLSMRATGFSDALRSGSPQATTMAAILKQMLGGSVGLNTALMLTGENQTFLNDATKRTAESLHHHTNEVEGWESTSKLLNVQLDVLKQNISRIFIEIGTKLIPVVSDVIGWFSKHKDMVLILAGVIGGVLVTMIATYIAHLVIAAATQVAQIALMVASWFGYESAVIAAEATTLQAFAVMMSEGIAWVGVQIAGMASAVAATVAGFITMAASALVWAGEMLVAGAIALLPFLPIIAAVAAVGIAAYFLYKHWDAVWGFIKSTTSSFVGFIKEHAKLIVGAIFIMFPPLGLLIAAVHQVWIHWDAIWGAIKTATSATWGFLKTVFGYIVKFGLWPIRTEIRILLATWRLVWTAMRVTMSFIWNAFIKPTASAIGTAIGAVGSALSWMYHKVWIPIWDGIKSAVQSVWDFIKPILDEIGDAISSVADAVGKVSGIASTIGGGIKSGVSGVGGMLGFADGGWVPGAPGQAQLAVVHGGEYVISRDMQQGNAAYGGPSSGGSGGGMAQVHVSLVLDGKVLHRSVQTQELRYQRRNARGGF